MSGRFLAGVIKTAFTYPRDMMTRKASFEISRNFWHFFQSLSQFYFDWVFPEEHVETKIILRNFRNTLPELAKTEQKNYQKSFQLVILYAA